jgi:hypothetical protein
MQPPKTRRRLAKLMILAVLGGAAFAYRNYRLDNAPEPSWSNG